MPGIVMLIDHSELSRVVYNALAAEFQIDVVIREAPVARSTFLKRRLKKLGWRKLAGQIVFAKFVVPLLKRETAQRRKNIAQQYALSSKEIPTQLVHDVLSVNNLEAIALLKRVAPQMVIVNGTRIIEKNVLQAIDGTFLNLHVGITPLYRGVHGGYWSLVSNDVQNFGTTVHKIDEGIDTGDIVAQVHALPDKTDNFFSYPWLQIACVMDALKSAVREALANKLETISAPGGKSRLWTHPTAFEYLRYRLSKGIR